mgnify:CR=1 FL=1
MAKKQLNVSIEEDLHLKLKIAAATSGRTLVEHVKALLSGEIPSPALEPVAPRKGVRATPSARPAGIPKSYSSR